MADKLDSHADLQNITLPWESNHHVCAGQWPDHRTVIPGFKSP